MTAIWSKNGYVTIPVEQEHIDGSMERNSSHCMTAMAIAEAVPDARHISVDLQTIRWTRKGLRYCFLTPHVCQDNIIAFDQGERAAIKPFELKMRPAFISKSGKKRTHTPTNGELRGTGLTVNKVQLHLDEPEPVRRHLDRWGKPSASAKMASHNEGSGLRIVVSPGA